MLPTEELFVYVYALVHDLILSGAVQVPRRLGPPPAPMPGIARQCRSAQLTAMPASSAA